MKRTLGAWIAATAALIAPTSASAAIPTVLGGHTISGSAIPCTAQPDQVRVCHGTDGGLGGTDLRLKSFDGSPLEVWVMLPPAPTTGPDGPYPLVVQSHGWDGPSSGPNDSQFFGPTADGWAKQGYAVLQLVARGWGDSCGTMQSRSVNPTACVNGYIRLDDDRYEVRDIQYAAGLLVDAGIVDPTRIGATGESYGGGVSLQLATLKDRVMNSDGSVDAWKSPAGTAITLAAAAPVIPWSDLVNSLVQNGHTLDYQTTSSTADLSPAGVLKQSFVAGLFALGAKDGYYSSTDTQADLPAWYAATNAGEPYDSNPEDQSILDSIAHYHSAYYLLDGKYGTPQEAPAPLLIANGFDDDLFPVDEAVRYYNLERSLYPNNAIALFDGDFGHMRAQNKAGDRALLSDRIQAFFDHYVKGTGAPAQLGAEATIETCPASSPSGGPYSADTWADLHPGEVDYSSKPAQTISSSAGDPTVAKAIDPVAGSGACATAPSADQGSGVATYRLPAATGSGYTLLGAATVIADLNVTGQFAYIAARLWDVNPKTNTETLASRVIYRIDSSKPNGLQVFQLHPGAWHFAAGHIAKLELLGQDPPYARVSNGTFSIAVSNLQLRLPVHEAPGTVVGVNVPEPPVTPNPQACTTTSPVAAVNRQRTHGSHKGIVVRGSASEQPCASASRAKRRKQHVVRVLVSIYKTVGHGRCRFLTKRGKLSAARSCDRPLWLRATGSKHWVLRLKHKIPKGHYLIRAQAIDALHHHQRKAAESVVKLTVT